MKTLLTTTAVLLATASIATASPTGAPPTTDIDGSPLAEVVSTTPTPITDPTGGDSVVVDPTGGTAALEAQIAELQAALALKTSDYNVLKNVHNITQASSLERSQRIWAADRINWHGYGDVYSEIKDTQKKRDKASYDIGTVTTGMAYVSGLKYANVNSVTVTSKYATFSIDTDLQVRNNATSINALYDIIEIVNDKAYNEGYKDGFNDGFETGYSYGWNDAIAEVRYGSSTNPTQP